MRIKTISKHIKGYQNISYDSRKINTLRDRLKSRFGSMSQRAFATYLSQTKDGQFDTIHKQFKKVI